LPPLALCLKSQQVELFSKSGLFNYKCFFDKIKTK